MKAVSSVCPIPTCSASLRSLGEFSFPMIKRRCLCHFVRFRATQSSPGLVIVSQDLDIGAATDAEEWVEQLGFVPV
jgi:hypothetical protein